MIDVMMSLLIIFLVIQPAMRKGLSVQLPTTDLAVAAEASIDQLVLEVRPGPTYFLNAESVPAAQLGTQLHDVFAARERRVLFVKAGGGVSWADVLSAVDSARGAGVTVVGLVPRTGR